MPSVLKTVYQHIFFPCNQWSCDAATLLPLPSFLPPFQLIAEQSSGRKHVGEGGEKETGRRGGKKRVAGREVER